MRSGCAVAAVSLMLGTSSAAPAQTTLRAGAAKVDITPTAGELPKNNLGILDHLYARAIVLENGTTNAALITLDAGVIPDALWQSVSSQLQTELGIPPERVLLTATHTHSAGAQRASNFSQKVVESVRLAKQKLMPARIGYGTGVSFINVNRQIVDPKTGRWWEGANYAGPSDKTVAVLKVEALDGSPIAVYYNYAVHAVLAGQLDQISGDIPGAASRYIEDSFDDRIVALWSSGAAGDQNPIYYQQTYDLREIRIKDYAKRGVDISNAMPPGGEGLDRNNPTVARLMNQQRQMVSSMGQFLGEEVMHVMRGIERTETTVPLYGSFASIQCPGRERTNDGRAGFEGTYKEGSPVELRLGLLSVGDVMIGAVNAEVFSPIAQRLKRESPYKATMMATLTNGAARSGYIPDDASFGKYTFEVLSSRLQPGCAESAIVNGILTLMDGARAARSASSAAAQSPSPSRPMTVTAAACSAERLGNSVSTSAIGEPVRGVTLSAPTWVDATNGVPAHCRVNGSIAPVDTHSTARPINFGVVLPATWTRRAAQLGGGGMNGFVPNLTGGGPGASGPSLLDRGFATYGSDSGHQAAFGGARGGGPRGGGPPGVNLSADWALNDEAIKNLGYMQMKKTHDAAMAIIERAYGERPRFNYYIGTSQGGREALTVAQRYPADYDGIAANVPIVGFSSLMLAPELIRIHEKPRANWVTPAKVNAIRGEFIRQCDGLDGSSDGIINNYMACRAIFDVTQGAPGRTPWAGKRCPNNIDPNPQDTSANACLTDGQISTLEFVYRRYPFASPLAHGTRSFGMWVPNTDPSGSGLILDARFRGQEGADDNSPMHAHLGVLGVTGFLMKNLSANPLDYTEGAFNQRRQELSAILDATDPDLSGFHKRGGKMIVTIGTNDTLASPGAQLDYFQSVLDRMGRSTVDQFARFFVMPQTGHGLSGTSYAVTGEGKTVPSLPIPNRYDQLGLLFDWVENKKPPSMSVPVTADERSLPLCSYPSFPRYRSGPVGSANSYECTAAASQPPK